MSSEMLPESDRVGDRLPGSMQAGASLDTPSKAPSSTPSSTPSSIPSNIPSDTPAGPPVLAPPPRLDAAEEDFVALRALLTTHQYHETTICARTECPTLYDFPSRDHVRGMTPPESGLDALIWLFLDGHALHPGMADALLGTEAVDLLERIGLVEPHGDTLIGTVLLYPTSKLYLISDRPSFREKGAPVEAVASDLVYPAITNSVRVFVSTLPPSRGKRHLELCSGTGIAALDAARRGADHAWAIDITARSTTFAAFNARLNGLTRVSAVQGDLYAPVEGQQFDIISAHPPYVPAQSTALIFRDGGEDGEQVSRAIIARLPEFLAPGGVFHCTCLVSARKGMPAWRRLRDALGAHSDEFDLVLLGNGFSDFQRHYHKQLLAASDTAIPGIIAQMRRLRELEVEQLEFCTIVMRRHGKPRVGATTVIDRDGRTGWAETGWLLQMQDFLGEGDAALERMLDARPRLASAVQLSLTYAADPGAEEVWTPTEGQISVIYPFATRLPVNAGDAAFYASCTGERTFAAILRDLQAEGSLPADLPPLQYMRTMMTLVAKGVLETDLLPFPNPPASQ